MLKQWSARTTLKSRTAFLSLIIFVFITGHQALAGRNGVDPDKVAAAETHMWQAYYAGDLLKLHRELVYLLHSQFQISPIGAERIAENLSMAAMKFEILHSNYEEAVLPDLEKAYRKLKKVLKRPYIPQEAAKAELAWWIARRTPGQNDPQEVGRKIAHLYALIYGGDRPEFLEAGILRAQAAQLRDRGGGNCDWKEVERLLRRSYRILAAAVQ
jgi:hypothetical protein